MFRTMGQRLSLKGAVDTYLHGGGRGEVEVSPLRKADDPAPRR